ncbi:MAG: hypothetical protein U0835_22920 [Isosphaeraceae bacterium]
MYANIGAWLSRLTTLEAAFLAVPDPAELAVSPDGEVFATAGADGAVKLWRTRDGTPSGVPMKHAKAVNTVAFSPDGRWLATGDDDVAVRLWDASNGASLSRRPTWPSHRYAGPSAPTAVDCSPRAKTESSGSST